MRRSVGEINNVVRTAVFAHTIDPNTPTAVPQRLRRSQQVVSGSPRSHVSRRKKRVFNKPPPRGKDYAPIRHPVTPQKYTPFNGPTCAPKPNTRDVGTSIVQHTNMLPKAGSFTKTDCRKQQSIGALTRLKKATGSGFHLTSQMLIMVLRFCFGLIVNFNWSWTQAIDMTAKLCQIKRHNMFAFANKYIESTEWMPTELTQKVRGRGSLKFISNHGKDHFSKLKEVNTLMQTSCLHFCFFLYTHTSCTQEHLKTIVEFVNERNTSQRGMCNVKAIQSHLLRKHGFYFEPDVVYYALRKRLNFKYRTPLCRRIVFSEERTDLGIDFCRNIDLALKLERRGEAIIIYMDETYCHLQHIPSKMWYRDVDIGTGRAERSRSKGSLAIILHAMCKDGWVLQRDEDGKPPVVNEWHTGAVNTCEMVFRGKVGRGDYHDNMDGDMFMKWVEERLVPTVRAKYPGKAVYLVMDNAPYHHGHGDDCFFARGKSKEEIQAKLEELDCRRIDVAPYTEIAPSPPVPPPDSPAHMFEGWVFVEKSTGECYMVDGVSDEGEGDVIVHTRVGRTRFGSVESAFEEDFRRLMTDDFMFVGAGQAALMYVRTIMDAKGKVPRNKRHIDRLRRACQAHVHTLRDTKW